MASERVTGYLGGIQGGYSGQGTIIICLGLTYLGPRGRKLVV